MFMLEQVIHDPGTGFWRKGLGHLFMHASTALIGVEE